MSSIKSLFTVAFALVAMLVSANSVSAVEVIYEAFDDPDTSLNGNTPGLGLSGTWNSGGRATQQVLPGSLTYGDLITSGGHSELNGGGLTQSGVTLGPALANSGLLDNGSELWFSFLALSTSSGTNTAYEFAIGTDRVRVFSNTADAIGVNIRRGDEDVQAATWEGASRSFANGSDFPLNETKLIVGKIVWGATNGDADTIEVFLPSEDLLDPGAVVSTNSAILDQSLFDTLSFDGKSSPFDRAPIIDEIRFGATFADVTPTPAANAVPEPTSLALVGLGGLAMLRRRRLA